METHLEGPSERRKLTTIMESEDGYPSEHRSIVSYLSF